VSCSPLSELAVVHGMQLAAWLEARPTTLVRDDKRRMLVSWGQAPSFRLTASVTLEFIQARKR
jgi:hypothetical protein